MSKPKLWIMCALSGSGKSRIAEQMAKDNPNTIIAPTDSIREELTGRVENPSKFEKYFQFLWW